MQLQLLRMSADMHSNLQPAVQYSMSTPAICNMHVCNEIGKEITDVSISTCMHACRDPSSFRTCSRIFLGFPQLSWMLDLATGRFIPPVNLYHSMESGNICDGVAAWTNAIFCVNTDTAAVCHCDLQQNH